MLWHDLRYALRQLRRAPGFALTVTLSAVAGLLLNVFARKLVGMLIYFNAQHEAGWFGLPALAVVAAGLMAALIPAARAASIEPLEALRNE